MCVYVVYTYIHTHTHTQNVAYLRMGKGMVIVKGQGILLTSSPNPDLRDLKPF